MNIVPGKYMLVEPVRGILSKGSLWVAFWGVMFCFSVCHDALAESMDCAGDSRPVAYFDGGSNGFDDEGEFEGVFDGEETVVSSRKFMGYWDGFQDFTFTFSHHLSSGTEAPDSGMVTNRSSLRCEFDKTFWGNLFVKFDGKTTFYSENDHVADAGEKGAVYDDEIREFYIQAGFDRFVVRAGKQVVVWGETDGDVINDVVSPRDESEFVFTDLEDARLGQYMAAVDIYSGRGDFHFFITLKPSVNETPDPGTRYDKTSGENDVRDEKPDVSDNEAGFKWRKTYGKFDLSVMTASLLQNGGVLSYDGGDAWGRVYERYRFYGIGASYTTGGFLFKVDVSFKEDYALQAGGADGPYRAEGSDLSDAAFGIEYDANGKYMMGGELTNRHVFDDPEEVYGLERNNTGIYLQFSKDFLNETLAFQYILFHQCQENNAFHKAELEYSFSDDIQLTLDYTFFQVRDKESFLWSYRNEDRVGAEFQYCF